MAECFVNLVDYIDNNKSKFMYVKMLQSETMIPIPEKIAKNMSSLQKLPSYYYDEIDVQGNKIIHGKLIFDIFRSDLINEIDKFINNGMNTNIKIRAIHQMLEKLDEYYKKSF